MRKVLVVFLWLVLLACASSGRVASSVAASGFQGGNPNTTVWVDKANSIYHCPGSESYGKTKNGFYTTQSDAQRQGFRPAYGFVCK